MEYSFRGPKRTKWPRGAENSFTAMTAALRLPKGPRMGIAWTRAALEARRADVMLTTPGGPIGRTSFEIVGKYFGEGLGISRESVNFAVANGMYAA